MIKNNSNMSFSAAYVEKRTRKSRFLKRVNQIINWEPIEKEINKAYKKGLSVDGRPSYSGLLLFKMLLLEQWYSLSDPQVEEMVNENLAMMVFCGLDLEDDVPDHSVISRFRSELVAKKALERIFNKVNKQLKGQGVIIKKGAAMVDASITDSPRVPDSKPIYEIAEDRQEEERSEEDKQQEEKGQQLIQKEQPGVDAEARWLKKGKKLHYGYKKYIATDERGNVLAVHTAAANEHDSHGLEPLIDKVDKDNLEKGVFTDKGFKVPNNDQYLKNKKIKNRIQHKAYRNRPLTAIEKMFNKLISRRRWVIERTFGGMVRWFGAGRARYVGLAKTHAQHVLEAIAYNLYRSPGIIMSNT